MLAEAGSRLLRMGEAFAAAGDDLDMAVVRYGDQRVYLKWLSGGLLCVVVSGRVNMPALRMAANLVCRRIAPAVGQAEPASLPAPARRERAGAERARHRRARSAADPASVVPRHAQVSGSLA